MNNSYANDIKGRMAFYYDAVEEKELSDMVHAQAYYRLRTIGSRHMISKNITLWSVGEFEHCFIIEENGKLSWEKVELVIDGLIKVRDIVVEPGPEHKRTVIRAVIITEDDPDRIGKKIKKYKNEVNYKMMIHGWSEISIVVINPHLGIMVHNSRKSMDAKYIEELFGVKE